MIMPFSEHVGIKKEGWSEVYETIFKKAVEGSGYGYRCERSTLTSGSFTRDIIENLKNAHVVLADITGFNGNVMWELGVRHSLSPRTIMVSRNNSSEKKFISDLGTYAIHFYENNGGAIELFKKEIKKVLKEFEDKPDKIDSPVFEVIKAEDRVLSSREQKIQIQKLMGLLTELIENLRITDQILDDKDLGISKNSVTRHRFEYDAINEFLLTNYVMVNNMPKILHNLKTWARHANQILDELIQQGLHQNTELHDEKINNGIDAITQVQNRVITTIPMLQKIILDIKNNVLEEINIPNVVTYDKKYAKLLEGLDLPSN